MRDLLRRPEKVLGLKFLKDKGSKGDTIENSPFAVSFLFFIRF